jgi:hypothetical protein
MMSKSLETCGYLSSVGEGQAVEPHKVILTKQQEQRNGSKVPGWCYVARYSRAGVTCRSRILAAVERRSGLEWRSDRSLEDEVAFHPYPIKPRGEFYSSDSAHTKQICAIEALSSLWIGIFFSVSVRLSEIRPPLAKQYRLATQQGGSCRRFRWLAKFEQSFLTKSACWIPLPMLCARCWICSFQADPGP